MRLLQIFLYPLSLFYGCIMMVRNWFYDWGILKSKTFDVPIIAVGNLSLGGTGKTPHVEYLMRLLKDYSVATLSRGYGRSSKGFIIGSKKSNVKYIGDEPLQYIKKFDKVKVAVDENRCRGTRSLLNKYPGTEVILLDDAFQHRSIKPGFSIVLSDYFHLYTEDFVFPSGRLREFPSGIKRADCIVISKTPKIFSPITRRRIIDDIKPAKGQTVLFSFIKYLDPVPLHDYLPSELPSKFSFILLFTGIADNELLKEHLGRMCNDLTTIKFRDHHRYTPEDIQSIKEKFDDLPTQKKLLLTTEKDAMRLKTTDLSQVLKTLPVYYLPIVIDFHETDKQIFDQLILDYVKKNKRNSGVPGNENPDKA
jgi:tetraacyldisaccharide 4'-kinase